MEQECASSSRITSAAEMNFITFYAATRSLLAHRIEGFALAIALPLVVYDAHYVRLAEAPPVHRQGFVT